MSDGFVDKENLPGLPSLSAKPKAGGAKVRGRLGLGLGLGRPQRVDATVLTDITESNGNIEANAVHYVPDALAPPVKPLAATTPLSPTPTPLPKATRTRAAAGGGLLARLNQTLPPAASPAHAHATAGLAGGEGRSSPPLIAPPSVTAPSGATAISGSIAPAGGPALSWTSSSGSSASVSSAAHPAAAGAVGSAAAGAVAVSVTEAGGEMDALSPLPHAVARRGARRAVPGSAAAGHGYGLHGLGHGQGQGQGLSGEAYGTSSNGHGLGHGHHHHLPLPPAMPPTSDAAETPLTHRRVAGLNSSSSGNGAGLGSRGAHSPLPAVPTIISLGSSSYANAGAGASKSSSSARPTAAAAASSTTAAAAAARAGAGAGAGVVTPAHAPAPAAAPASAPASTHSHALGHSFGSGLGSSASGQSSGSRVPMSASAPATAPAAAAAAAAVGSSLRSLVSPVPTPSSGDAPLFPSASAAAAASAANGAAGGHVSGHVSGSGSKSGPFKTPMTPTRTHALLPGTAPTATASAGLASGAAAVGVGVSGTGEPAASGFAAAPARVSLRHLVSIRSSSTSAAPTTTATAAPTSVPAPPTSATAAAAAAAAAVGGGGAGGTAVGRERRQLRPIVAPVRAPAPATTSSLAPAPAPAPADAAAAAAAASAASVAAGGTGEVIHVNAVPYAVAQEVGVGGSARVYRVLSPEGRELALKKISLSPECKGHVANFEEEIRLLLKLRNQPHVIQLVDTEVADENTIFMLFEFGRMDMAQVLKHPTRAPSVKGLQPAVGPSGKVIGLGWEQIRYFWREFLMCVDMCHENGIIHLDLKPSNFVLVGDQLKIIDFGIAKEIDDDATSVVRESPVGTLNYMSPESILGMMTGTDPSSLPQYKLNRSADIWALGCMLYQMIYGKAPFAHVRSELRLSAITNPQVPIELPPLPAHLAAVASESDTAAVSDALLRCLERDPKKRITLPELLAHGYVLGTSAGAAAAGAAAGGSGAVGGGLRAVTSFALCAAMGKAVAPAGGEEDKPPQGVDAVARRVLGGISPEDRADLAAWLREQLADVMYPPAHLTQR